MIPSADDEGFSRFGSPLDDALAWFTRLHRPEAGTAEQSAFAEWLAADPAHAEAYGKVERLWQSPALSSALARVGVAVPVSPPSPPARRRRMHPPRWAMAAGVLLFTGWSLIAAGLLDRWRADYASGAGEQRRVLLADGSAVILNTDSALALDFSAGRRGVRLLRGEAYFEVQPDSARPFTVSSGIAQVRVVGTRFNVRAGEEGGTAVDVESGIVACANQRGDSVKLTAGQHTDISQQGVAAPTPADTNRAFAWRNGRLIFQDQPLVQVLAELDRYHPGTIVVVGGRLAQTRVSGNYKLDDTAAIIHSLAEIADARVIGMTPYLTLLR